MIERAVYKTITWIDVIAPTPEEVREIIVEANIPPEFTKDLGVPTPQNETLCIKGACKLTLDFPIVKRTDISHPHEIKFILTKTHLVTFRYEDMEAMHRFRKEFEVLTTLKTGPGATTPRLLIVLLNHLYNSLYTKINHLESRLKDIEEEIFSGHEKEMVFAISEVSRRVIMFRQVLGGHAAGLEIIKPGLAFAFGKKYEHAADSLESHYQHLTRHVYALKSLVDDLRDTNMGLLTTKQNEVMKTFTILAFITFPLTLFTSTFGMNTQATPIIGRPFDFWIIMTIMLIVSVGFFSFFKYKRWM